MGEWRSKLSGHFAFNLGGGNSVSRRRGLASRPEGSRIASRARGVLRQASFEERSDRGGLARTRHRGQQPHRSDGGSPTCPLRRARRRPLDRDPATPRLPIIGPQCTGAMGETAPTLRVEPATPLSLPDRPSVAVLPFSNLSGDPQQDYFADGMVEEIVTGLSRIKWLSVISRNSTFIYKNKPAPVDEVRSKFGVRYVVQGSIRKSGNRVRIGAQLIDAETGAHLWVEQYDRVLEDVFAVQDEITMCVVGAIEPSLRKVEFERIRRQRPNSFTAYDLLLQSQQFVFAGMPTEAAKAISLLEEALDLEPDYSAAHAYMSWCLHALFGRGGLREEDRLAAIRHARTAVRLGNDDATALAIAALCLPMMGMIPQRH